MVTPGTVYQNYICVGVGYTTTCYRLRLGGGLKHGNDTLGTITVSFPNGNVAGKTMIMREYNSTNCIIFEYRSGLTPPIAALDIKNAAAS